MEHIWIAAERVSQQHMTPLPAARRCPRPTLQAKQAHWNVKGPSFIALHELFDSVVEEIVELADDLAEGAVELGGTAFGTVRTAARTPRLPEYPLDIRSGREHVTALSAASPGSVPRPARGLMPRPRWATPSPWISSPRSRAASTSFYGRSRPAARPRTRRRWPIISGSRTRLV
jgi:hypothetical protein